MGQDKQNRQSTADLTWTVYIETMREGRAFEDQAERCRMEAEQAFADAGLMKTEGRARVAGEGGRLLPQHERATDVRTNTYKVVGDTKADHVYYSAQASMYAALATMKFTKAQAILTRITVQSGL